MSEQSRTDFTSSLGGQIEPAIAGLAAQLGRIRGLSGHERDAVRKAAAEAVYEAVHRKVTRVLVLELNAARVTGVLTAGDTRARWEEFLDLSSASTFWSSLGDCYPSLPQRVHKVIDNRCAAAVTMARRFSADRAALTALLEGGPVELSEVTFGAGDSHRAGQTVAILRCAPGLVVYKPRSLDVDAVLAVVLADVLDAEPPDTRIRVPKVVTRDGYGWAEHVTHRHCDNDAELASFYTGIGHWLAVMGLLGGSDLHAENLIACGPVPVVVDCETLFTPLPPARPSGLGLAADRAREMVEGTVLRTGLLPGRGLALGWRGVDGSAVGALPGQQPQWQQPVIIDEGTDMARMGLAHVNVAPVVTNHPSSEPALGRYWDRVVAGFSDLTGRLRALDDAGKLRPMLAAFEDCRVRVVPRATEVYAELGRMLWHPVSLHDEPTAVERAAELLAKSAEFMPLAPSDPEVIAAEIAELLDGDVPFFTTTAGRGRLEGPRGTKWLPEADLVADALRRWRAADLAFERRVIQAALVSAYLNEGWLPSEQSLRVDEPRTDDLDGRRRRLAAGVVRQVVQTALRAEDGTVTWIAPVLNPTGWAVEPLGSDVYGGVPGVAVLIAAYLREMGAGRADPVEGLEPLLERTLCTIRAAEDWHAGHRRSGTDMRPRPPGGYIGLGAQIWAWQTLDRLGGRGTAGTERARALAEFLPASIQADEAFDVLTGTAGAIVPLLDLAETTGESRWLEYAVLAGERLIAAATIDARGASWPTPRWPDGLGGFAHGATGIGWALAHLALAAADDRFAATADAAFAFEESLYDEEAAGWSDLREPGQTAAAWCHGAVGIGLAAFDLRQRSGASGHDGPDPADTVIRRATAAAWSRGLGWNHTLCHGDLGCWELIDAATAVESQPSGLDSVTVTGHILASLEKHGPVSGFAREAFAPGLVAGVGGIAYQLLRMHPDSNLPSVLTLGRDPN